MKMYIYLLISIMIISSAGAAVIRGSVYDLSLDKVEDVIVTINTRPGQRYVALNGTYRFNVPSGMYTVAAYYKDINNMSAAEKINIVDDGDYVLDLFLYPDFDEELAGDIDFDIEQPYEEKASVLWLLFPLAALMSVFLLVMVNVNTRTLQKTMQNELEGMEDELYKIIRLLKENQGRMTQKNLRQNLTYSESKISMMLTELEDLGYIKKIRKGRGNIIILIRK